MVYLFTYIPQLLGYDMALVNLLKLIYNMFN